MGPFHGMSDSERAADALIKGKMELNPRVKTLEQTADNHEMKLTCIDSKNIWIIHSINCQQVANDLEEMTRIHMDTKDSGDIDTLFTFKKTNQIFSWRD